MYKVKKTVRPGQRVILKRTFKPYGRKIDLDTANQAQLKHLYEMRNKYIEFVPEKLESKKAPEKKPNTELKDVNKS